MVNCHMLRVQIHQKLSGKLDCSVDELLLAADEFKRPVHTLKLRVYLYKSAVDQQKPTVDKLKYIVHEYRIVVHLFGPITHGQDGSADKHRPAENHLKNDAPDPQSVSCQLPLKIPIF